MAVRGRVHASKPLYTARGRAVAILQTREPLVAETHKAPAAGDDEQRALSYRRLQSNIRTAAWAVLDGSCHHVAVWGGHTVELPIEISDRTAGLASVLVDQGERLLASGRDRQRALLCGAVVTAVGRLAIAVDNPHDFKGAIRRYSNHVLVLKPTHISNQTLSSLVAEKEQQAKDAKGRAHLYGWLGGYLFCAVIVHAANR